MRLRNDWLNKNQTVKEEEEEPLTAEAAGTRM